MNTTITLSLLGVSLVSTLLTAEAQTTTPTGTATSGNTPVGAVAPDQTPTNPTRAQRRTAKRDRNRQTQNAGQSSGNATNTQEGRYRQSSTASGNAVNSSNTGNYNSNNAVNPATGVGSNPETTNPTAPPNNGGSGQSSGSSSGRSSTGSTPPSQPVGAGEAIRKAQTSETPAVVAGSTVRNTSISDYVASSPNYTTLQNALQTADLNETLKGTDQYTLFAPSNASFKKLPAATQAGLLEGANRDALRQVLSYHVVKGVVDAAELGRRIEAGGGKAQLQTLAGTTLTARVGSNGRVTLTDERGNSATVETTDVRQSNGVVHGISAVLMPLGVSFR